MFIERLSQIQCAPVVVINQAFYNTCWGELTKP